MNIDTPFTVRPTVLTLLVLAAVILCGVTRCPSDDDKGQFAPEATVAGSVDAEVEGLRSSLRVDSPARDKVHASEAADGAEDVEGIQDESRKLIYVDRLTRNDDEALYDDAIRDLGLKNLSKSLAMGHEGRVAEFTGFQSWNSLQEAIEDCAAQSPHKLQALTSLIDRSMKASQNIEHHAIIAWDNPRYLEAWDPNGDHDRKAWRGTMGAGSRGLFRFSTSTSIGDRAFCLHFDSGNFPGLESELQELLGTKTEFWSSYGD